MRRIGGNGGGLGSNSLSRREPINGSFSLRSFTSIRSFRMFLFAENDCDRIWQCCLAYASFVAAFNNLFRASMLGNPTESAHRLLRLKKFAASLACLAVRIPALTSSSS